MNGFLTFFLRITNKNNKKFYGVVPKGLLTFLGNLTYVYFLP